MKFSYHHSIFDVNCLVFIDCVTLYHNEIGKGIKIRKGCLIDFSSASFVLWFKYQKSYFSFQYPRHIVNNIRKKNEQFYWVNMKLDLNKLSRWKSFLWCISKCPHYSLILRVGEFIHFAAGKNLHYLNIKTSKMSIWPTFRLYVGPSKNLESCKNVDSKKL